MPLTPNEYSQIAKAIMYSETHNVCGRGCMVRKDMMFSILNDYCPNLFVSYEKTDSKEVMNFLLKEQGSELVIDSYDEGMNAGCG